MEITINIDDYLSEDEKKQYAIEAFQGAVMKGMRDAADEKGNIYFRSDYERVVGNAVYAFLESKASELLGEDASAIIKERTLKTLKAKDYTHTVFRRKGTFDREDSLAVRISNEAVESYRDQMTKKIHEKLDESIETFGEEDLLQTFSYIFFEFIQDRFTSKN